MKLHIRSKYYFAQSNKNPGLQLRAHFATQIAKCALSEAQFVMVLKFPQVDDLIANFCKKR